MKLLPLLGREPEMLRLEEAWSGTKAGVPQLAVFWGRRRVGKTFLLNHFVQGKRAVFFAATQQAESVELGRFLDTLRRDLGAQAADLTGGAVASWEAGLRLVAALAVDRPLVVVIDEAPYLSRSTPGFASIVQAVWDRVSPSTKLLLILTGSAVGTVEAMLGAGGALRGRPTLAVRLDPLDLWASRAFLPRLEPVSFFEAYAACGGYALHLRAWDEQRSTHENLLRLAASPGGLLLEDAAGMLAEELSESVGYARILAAIGRGRTRYSDIAGEAGQRVEHPLAVLVRGGFVRKAVPVGAPKAAHPLYELGDPYLSYWFRVLYSDLAFIEGGQGAAVLARTLDRWRQHLGWSFEELARAHARRLVARSVLPDDLVIGRWWAVRGDPVEVDVLGLRGSRSYLIGEARWQSSPLGARDLQALQNRIRGLPRLVEEPVFALWGRAGVAEAAKASGALGFDPRTMLEG